MYKTKPKYYIVIQIEKNGTWKDLYTIRTNKNYKLSKTAQQQLDSFMIGAQAAQKTKNFRLKRTNRRIDNGNN